MNKLLMLLILVSFSSVAYENCASENTAELETCSYENYKSEDGVLNYLYKEIVASFPKIKNEVKKSQILWIKARDKTCAYTPEDGEEYKINQNACMYQQTYERNRELKAIITKEANKGGGGIESSPEWSDYIKYHCDFMEKQFSDTECKDRNEFLHSEQ